MVLSARPRVVFAEQSSPVTQDRGSALDSFAVQEEQPRIDCERLGQGLCVNRGKASIEFGQHRKNFIGRVHLDEVCGRHAETLVNWGR